MPDLNEIILRENPKDRILKTLNLPFNNNGRDFVISDIHGCYDELMLGLLELSFDQSVDRVFSSGDNVDRGPKSFECLKLIREPWFYSVLGNHESMMIEALLNNDHRYMSTWLMNGGEWYRDVLLEDLLYYVRWAAELPYSIKVGEGDRSFGMVHTDPPSDWNEITNSIIKDYILWGRNRMQQKSESLVRNIGTVYCGHTPTKDILKLGNVVFIDTGACFSKGKLTIIEIE